MGDYISLSNDDISNDYEPVYATLHFYYDDPESMRRFKLCNQAGDMALAIWSLDNDLRNKWKHGKASDQMMTIVQVRAMLWDNLDSYGIDLGE